MFISLLVGASVHRGLLLLKTLIRSHTPTLISCGAHSPHPTDRHNRHAMSSRYGVVSRAPSQAFESRRNRAVWEEKYVYRGSKTDLNRRTERWHIMKGYLGAHVTSGFDLLRRRDTLTATGRNLLTFSLQNKLRRLAEMSAAITAQSAALEAKRLVKGQPSDAQRRPDERGGDELSGSGLSPLMSFLDFQRALSNRYTVFLFSFACFTRTVHVMWIQPFFFLLLLLFFIERFSAAIC